MSERTTNTSEIEAAKAAVIADISKETWAKIRALGGITIEIHAEEAGAAKPKKRKAVSAEEPRHVSDEEWHARHP